MEQPRLIKRALTRPTTLALVLLFGWALVLGVCLWRLPDYVPGVRQTRHDHSSPLLAGANWLGQSFLSDQPDLAQVKFLMGAYRVRRPWPLRFQLFRLPGRPPDGAGLDLGRARLIHEEVFDSCLNNRMKAFTFPPQPDSAGVYYLARLGPARPGQRTPILVWLYSASPPECRLWLSGRPVQDSAAFSVHHLSSQSKLARLLARLDRSRPSWLTLPAATALACFVWLAVLFLVRPAGWPGLAAWLAPPLLGLLAWGIWLGAAEPRGLWAEYRVRSRQRITFHEAEQNFARGLPGRRFELDLHLDAPDIGELELGGRDFFLTWSGRLLVPGPGRYVFELESGAPARLSLAGREVVAVEPAAGQVVKARGQTTLEAGPVDLAISYSHSGGRVFFRVRWGRAGERLARLEGVDLLRPGQGLAAGDGLARRLGPALLYASLGPGLFLLGRRLWRQVLRGLNRPEVHLTLLLGLIALLARLIYLFQAENAYFGLEGGFYDLAWDQEAYLFRSHGLLKGVWPGHHHAPFTYGPAVSFALAGLQALLGRDVLILRLASTCLGLLTIFVTAATARRLWGLGAGVAAGALMAWSGVNLVHEAAPLIAGWLTLLLISGVYFAQLTQEDSGYLPWLRAGLAFGLATLFRGNVVLVLPWLGLGLLLSLKLHRRLNWAGLSRWGLLFAAAGLTIGLAVAFNQGLYGNHVSNKTLAPTGGGPNNLWMGNSPGADGLLGVSPEYLAEVERKLAAHQTTYLGEVAGFIRGQPGRFLKLTLSKLWRFFNGWEVANNVDYYVLRDGAPILGWGMFNSAVLLPLGLAGLVLGLGQWRRLLPLLAVTAGYVLAVVAFFVLARFRLPLYPVLAVLAGFGLSRLRAGLRPALAFAGLFLVFYLAVNWDQVWLADPEWTSPFWQYWAFRYAHFP